MTRAALLLLALVGCVRWSHALTLTACADTGIPSLCASTSVEVGAPTKKEP